MSATSISKGNMHNSIKRIISLLEDLLSEIRELNAHNKKVKDDETARPRRNKQYNNDSLRK